MRRTMCVVTVAVLAAGWLLSAGGATRGEPASAPAGTKLSFARDIQPILAAKCFACHGPDEKHRKSGLRLDVREKALAAADSGARAIVPRQLKESELVVRILATGDERMPPADSKLSLTDREKQLLQEWIAQGAEYQKHWSFVTPQRPQVPVVRLQGWVRNPIDAFVLARLEREQLQPSREADRYTLARRVSLDLTGLPPTWDAVEKFVHDPSPDAYEKFVDQVLKQPQYGEHWARPWLDLARYADSNGYADDKARTIWRYRDWVIEAINRNLPFDQFTIEQIAGDMLPQATQEQILATAFHRNTLTNDEGGTNDEEFRVAAVVDRVNTTMQVWMGLTMMCAQCHDHKYDPISQEEYYKIFALLNQTEDADKGDNSPLLSTLTPDDLQNKARFEAELAELNKQLLADRDDVDDKQKAWEAEQMAKPELAEKLPKPIKEILAIAADKRSEAQRLELRKHYRSTAAELKELRDRIASVQKQLASAQGVTTPIMRELPPEKRRKTNILMRGNFLDKGKEVGPGLPVMLPQPPADAPLNRLTLARWLVSRENPLTARVTVNRYWELVFGNGLVETPEDFGIRGKLPMHPELLDWLAVEFMERHWDVKQLLKLIVTSATYRQSSQVTPPALERDPENKLLGRGPRFRSPAEVVRDQTLFVSGLLSAKMYGKSVRPPRPKLGLNAAFGGATDWETSPGEDKFRRALYTEWRRTTPYPSMVTFDAPSRNVCTVTRPRTNTPLQALVTLNDPVYVESAQALGRRIVKEGGSSVSSRVEFAIRTCLTRPATPVEIQRLSALFEQAKTVYAADPKAAQLLATDPIGPLPAGLEAAEMAAWTVVGNVLLNLDEMFAKR